VKVTADTNILVRAAVNDDEAQARAAMDVLRGAELIAVPMAAMCEFAWVLRSVYKFESQEISGAIEALLGAANVSVNRPAIDAGLAALNAGGDFADGVIAYEGCWLGGEIFVSFDRNAVGILASQGQQTRLLE
jgi:predicted nucleic-acid-binding protein